MYPDPEPEPVGQACSDPEPRGCVSGFRAGASRSGSLSAGHMNWCIFPGMRSTELTDSDPEPEPVDQALFTCRKNELGHISRDPELSSCGSGFRV